MVTGAARMQTALGCRQEARSGIASAIRRPFPLRRHKGRRQVSMTIQADLFGCDLQRGLGGVESVSRCTSAADTQASKPFPPVWRYKDPMRDLPEWHLLALKARPRDSVHCASHVTTSAAVRSRRVIDANDMERILANI